MNISRSHLRKFGCYLLILGLGGCSTTRCDGEETTANPRGEIETRSYPPSGARAQHRPGQAKRRAIPPKRQTVILSAAQIVVAYRGSKKAPAIINRSKDEARARAAEAYNKLLAGADFAETAREYSDGPFKAMGGDLGTFPARRVAPKIAQAVLALKIDQVSPPSESPYGFHIIKRQRPQHAGRKGEKIHLRNITITHSSSLRKPDHVTRSKKDAEALMQQIEKKLAAPDADFAALAGQHSEGPGKKHGGDIGHIGVGRLPPAIADQVSGLKQNELSPIIETKFGFHIIQRLP